MATPRIDYAARTFDDIKTELKSAIDQFLTEWTDRSDTDMGVVLLELFAYVGDLLSHHTNNVANEALFDTATELASVLSYAKMLHYSVRSQQPSSAMFVFTLSAVQGVPVTLPAGTRITATQDAQVLFETTAALSIPAGKLGDELDTFGNYLYQVEAKNMTQLEGEILGSVQPRADTTLDFLEFELSAYPVVKETVRVFVYDGSSWVEWTRKDLFVDSQSTDKHFTTTMDETGKLRIRFGNGVLGALPEVGSDNVKANYGFGGLGASGNGFAVGYIDKLVTPLPNVLSAKNVTVTTGGETFGNVDEIKKNLPFSWAALDRAVVVEDYTALAKMYAGIAKASAVYNTSTRKVDVYALPTGGGNLSVGQKASLLLYMQTKAILGRSVAIKDPWYVDVDAIFQVSSLTTYDQDAVLAAVGTALEDHMAFDNRELGQSEYLSDIYALVEKVEGVNFVNIQQFHRRPVARAGSDNGGIVSFSTIETNVDTTARTWQFKMISSTIFEVRSETMVANGTLGVEFDNGEVKFTATAGSPVPQLGDVYEIRVSSFAGNVLVDPLEILRKGTFVITAI